MCLLFWEFLYSVKMGGWGSGCMGWRGLGVVGVEGNVSVMLKVGGLYL